MASTFTAQVAQSPYPPSFDNSAWLYGFALAALMCIATFTAITGCWMARDIWRDRMSDHPTSLSFAFRGIITLVCTAAFIRSMPEVVYMTAFGEVQASTMGIILTFKRMADIFTLPIVVSWMAWLVVVYPHTMIELRSFRARTTPSLNPLGIWSRLVRPFAIMMTVVVISALMAVAKGSMGHG